ncbi:MAG: TonB-dependent receptor [Balneolaceae bacterium]|nr:TonB-dependent receptor [Balneolaceae bacterium]
MVSRKIFTFLSILLMIVLCSFIVSPEALAQQNSTIRVIAIAGDDGIPIAGANVLLLDPESGEILDAGATNNDGLFQFSGIDVREYRIKVSFIGYETYEQTLTTEANTNKIIQARLPVKVEALDELVVEDKREVTTGQVGLRQISRQDISRVPTPIAGGDLASYLQGDPGIISTGDRGGELYIRGGTPSQNKVLVDGMPIVKPFHISNFFSAFPQKAIQTVDLYAGGFGAEYSDATSAIIDVNLRPGNFRQYSGSGSVSPYLASFQVEGPFQTNHQSFMLMGRKSTISESSPFVSGDDGSDIDFYDITGRYSVQGYNFNCSMTGIITHDSGKINPARDFDLSWQNTVVGGRCSAFGETIDYPINVTVGYSHYKNSEASDGETNRSSSFSEIFLKFDNTQRVFGIPLDFGFKMNFGDYEASLAERFTDLESFEEQTILVNAFISNAWEVSDQLTLNMGVAGLATTFQPITLEPRFRAAYNPAGRDDIEVSMALGRYYQASTAIGDVRNAGSVFKVRKPINNNFALPSADHAILGYSQRFGNTVTLNVEGYIKNHHDISVSKLTPTATIETETTTAEGLGYGADIQLEYERNPFYLLLGYGYGNVEYKATSDDLGSFLSQPVDRYHPAHDQRHKVNSIVSYEIGDFTTSARWEFGSGRPFTQVFAFDLLVDIPDETPTTDSGTARTLFSRPFDQRLPVYHRLDVSVERSFRFTPNFAMDLKAGAINIYDRDNVFYYDSNNLQRVNQTSLFPYVSLRAQFN